MNIPDDYESHAPKKWVSRKNAPETPAPQSRPGIDVSDVPGDEKLKALSSVQSALTKWLREENRDSISGWPSVWLPKDIADSDDMLPRDLHPAAKLAVMKRFCGELFRDFYAPGRFQHARENRTKPIKNKWATQIWISGNWFNFYDGEEESQDFDKIGLCYFTSACAAEIISNASNSKFTKKQFEDFRDKWELAQIPVKYRRSGVFRLGELVISRVGGKLI